MVATNVTWSVDPDGRRRYHGRARKGPPSRADLDGQDLRIAARELEAARAALLQAHAMLGAGIGKREAVRVAVSKLALASRMIDEVVMRRAGEPGDCVRSTRAA